MSFRSVMISFPCRSVILSAIPFLQLPIHRELAYGTPMGSTRKVYLYFMLCKGWQCQFIEADLKTPLPRTLTFQTPDKVIELAKRGGALTDLASRQALDYAIQLGRGSVWLHLTPEQYGEVERPRLSEKLILFPANGKPTSQRFQISSNVAALSVQKEEQGKTAYQD
jgi:hypothetical protein